MTVKSTFEQKSIENSKIPFKMNIRNSRNPQVSLTYRPESSIFGVRKGTLQPAK
jgi:hypothetical protein